MEPVLSHELLPAYRVAIAISGSLTSCAIFWPCALCLARSTRYGISR